VSKYTDLQILDENDLPLPAGQTGEICVRPREPWIHDAGYYDMPQATAGAMRNMWMHSGDRGYLDDDGYLLLSSTAPRKRFAGAARTSPPTRWKCWWPATQTCRKSRPFPWRPDLSEDDVVLFVSCARAPASSTPD